MFAAFWVKIICRGNEYCREKELTTGGKGLLLATTTTYGETRGRCLLTIDYLNC